MHPQFYNSISNQVYISLWNKYRPAILQMMIASAGGSKEYKLSDHEFKALGPKEKNFSFDMQIQKGKAGNISALSVNAKDLLEMLNMSRKACELMDEITFDFKLDKQFVLHISRA